MIKKYKKVWKYVVGKVEGDAKAYGATDWDNKTITINKKYHKSKWNHKSDVRKNKDGRANITDSILHEFEHKNHPKEHEKTVRKKTRKKFKKLSKKQKQKLLSKFNK